MAENYMRQREDYTKMHSQHNVDVDTPSHHHMHAEDRLSTILEEQTSKIPSVFYLAVAGAAAITSLALQFSDDRETKHLSQFVGMWVPSILIVGLYNKLVKRLGH
jgi:hypothetical protein